MDRQSSLNGASESDSKAGPEALSKREQMKLDQAIKIIQSQENQQIRPPKRKGGSNLPQAHSNPRKQIKIDGQIHPPISEDIMSSSSQSREPNSSTPQLQNQQSHQHANHLNPLYEVPEGQGALFNYLLCYSYSQGEKQFQKEGQDWQNLDNLDGEKLVVFNHPASEKICKRLDGKFNEQRDRLKEPFGKNHREFGQKFLKKEFLLQ